MTLKILIALLTGTLAIAGSISSIKEWKKIKRKQKVFIVMGIILASLICVDSINGYISENRRNKIEAKTGVLKAVKYTNQVFSLDGSGAIFQTNTNDVALLGTRINKLYKFKNENGKLYVSFNIRDKTGKKIADVIDNKWTIYDDTYVYNYDKAGIEIKAPVDDRVIFHFEYKNSIPSFGGLLVDENGNGVFIFSDAAGGYMQPVVRDKTKIDYDSLKPLFKYPIEKFIGRRVSS